MTIKTRTKQASRSADDESERLYACLENFGDYIARVVASPDTPDDLRNALQAIIVNIISNESGYSWACDEEGLRFLIPRFLFHMNEAYARGIIHSTGELVHELLPSSVRAKIQQGGAS